MLYHNGEGRETQGGEEEEECGMESGVGPFPCFLEKEKAFLEKKKKGKEKNQFMEIVVEEEERKCKPESSTPHMSIFRKLTDQRPVIMPSL